MSVFSRQQQRRLLTIFQLYMPLRIAGGLRQRLTFLIKQSNLNPLLRCAVFQTLRKDIKTIVITVGGNANVAEGKERGRITVVVMSGLIHYRNVHARLLQGLNVTQRQQAFFTRITRRIEIKTPGIDQIRHFEQVVRFPVRKSIAVFPLADECRQRLRLHAKEVYIHLVHVQRHDRQAFHHFSRQQRATAGKADARLNVPRGNGFFIRAAKSGFIQRR